MLLNPLHNPLTDFLRSVMRSAFYLNFGCTYVGVKTGSDSAAHELGFGLKVKVFEEHGYGKNLRKWVGDVLTLRLRPTTMDGLKNGPIG